MPVVLPGATPWAGPGPVTRFHRSRQQIVVVNRDEVEAARTEAEACEPAGDNIAEEE